jgi:hypothetical protein
MDAYFPIEQLNDFTIEGIKQGWGGMTLRLVGPQAGCQPLLGLLET